MNTENIQRAVIYCRVSSKKQTTDGHGLDSQEHRCRKHAYERGYEVAAVFQDDITGEGDFMKRPGMVALLAYLDAQPTENFVVIFDDLKRYARDTEFHLKLRREMSARNATRECLNFKFEDTPEGEFVETILAAQGQLERKQNRRQVIQKMKARLEKGYWVFYAPVGYSYKKVSGHGRLLVKDEPEANIIKEAFEGFASGRFQIQIEATRFLTSHNIIKPHQSGNVSRSRVKEILTNPIYAGYLDYPKWNIHMMKGQHEPLVSFEVFRAVQERLKASANVPARKDIHEDFPLRGFVTCATCEKPMTAAWSKGRNKKYPYYICYEKCCPEYRKSIRKEKIEAEFETLLYNLTPSRDLLMMAANMLKELWVHNSENAKQQSVAIEKELSATDKKIAQYLDRIVKTDSETVIATYEKQINFLEENKIILREKIANCGRPVKDFDETFRTALEFLGNPQKLWGSDVIEDKRAVLKLVFAEKLPYARNEGFRTAKTTLPINMLGDFSGGMFEMVECEGKRTNSICEVFEDWNYVLSHSDLSEINFDNEETK